jgi:hypothetical protein
MREGLLNGAQSWTLTIVEAGERQGRLGVSGPPSLVQEGVYCVTWGAEG